MITKNILRIKHVILVIAACALASCEDWLDVAPVTETEAEELFRVEDGFRDALTGVYGIMTEGRLYGRELTFGTLDALAGYYSPIQGGSNVYYSFHTQYPYKRNDNPNGACVGVIDNMWNGMYHAIANVNSPLKYIDEKKTIFSEDNYRLLKGEAIGLRAFLHLDLLRLYGTVYAMDAGKKTIPFVEHLGPEVTPRSTVREALRRIISDLEMALSLMENDPIIKGQAPNRLLASTVRTSELNLPAYHNRKYRFNYYAVKAALARAYLWGGDKSKALQHALDIIGVQASRFPWVQDKFLITIPDPTAEEKDRTFTTEHIFALHIRDMETYVPFYYTSAYNQGTGLATKSAVRNAIYENDPVDPRNQYMFTAFEDDQYFLTKLYQGEKVDPVVKAQMPVIRISEMFYIAAECDPTVINGLNYLNRVREARKLDPLSDITTPEALQVEIQKEYQKEFMGEGQLWYYYKRQNLATLPFAPAFDDTDLYVFDLPETELSMGGSGD